MENLIFCLNATIPVFLLMVIGYLFRQMGLLNESFVKTLNRFNFTVTLPVLLFRDISQSEFSAIWDTKYVLFCFLATLASIAVIWVMAYFLLRDKTELGEFVQASYRSSAAVLGIAFIQNIYGSSGMAPLMIIGTVPLYNMAAVIILSFTRPGMKKLDQKEMKKACKKIATNPIIIGILLGMISSLIGIHYPVIIEKTVNSVAGLATPLALIGLGAGFEGRKAVKKIKSTAVCTAVKLIVLPAVFLPVALWLGFDGEKMVAILVMLGAPTTVSCYIMAKNMGHEGVLTSSVVVAATFFSSITLTGWLYLLRMLGTI